MNLKFVLTALAAFSAAGVAHCALIPSTLYVEEIGRASCRERV